MPLDDHLADLVDQHLSHPDALAAVGLGICWPNTSPFSTAAALHVEVGETIETAARRIGSGWASAWLDEAGHTALSGDGTDVSTGPATAAGPVAWTPPIRLARLDDQISNSTAPTHPRYRRRLVGELAVYALWRRACNNYDISEIRPDDDLSGNTRGTLFRDFLVHAIQAQIPDGWRVEPEVALTKIRGLHMRRSVGKRSSDIVVIDDGNRLVAVVSSKWTWRSDRGTEAAQMVPLRQFRPDVPYTLVTAEFPRLKVIAQESVEDRAYHLCPAWAGAWLAVNSSDNPASEYPTLDHLYRDGAEIASNLGLAGLNQLIADVTDAGTIL